MSQKTNLSPEQANAANPALNVWVQANAGTGKTSVLIQRLLKILFRNNKSDHKDDGILCLTYTNTGAAEMRNRILAALRGWAYATDDELTEILQDIADNKIVTAQDIADARHIFYKYIDNPDMLKVRTIHSFCEEILRRFPIEAGISPAWRLVSGADQKRLLKDAFHELINSPAEFDNLTTAFSRVADQISEQSLENLMSILTGQYRNFFKLQDNFNYRQQFIDTTKQFLKISNTPIDAFYAKSAVSNRIKIPDIIADEKKLTGYMSDISNAIKKFFPDENSILSDDDFETYKHAFLINAGTRNVNAYKKDYLIDEIDLVYNLNQEKLNRDILENTIALFDLTDYFAQKYLEIKRLRGLLDFDDLILLTNKLFSDSSKMGWVLSQLDSRLRYILLDEAQDTSPEQWDILKSMITNFFTDGDKDVPRSIFVVGDVKQSIFSFQGADPKSFSESKDNIGAQIANDMREISDVPLTRSFRSVGAILSAVDYFFNDESIRYLSKFSNSSHVVFRTGDAGLVEIHKASVPGENENTSQARRKYIIELADKIQNLIKNETLESAGRPIIPSDIMILVQRRDPFVAPLIAELQSRKIPVAGSDRIFLPDFPAIRDLMNVVSFASDTTDDYMLACVLKSPLFRFSEEQLFNVCRAKIAKKQSLFDIIKESNPDIYSELSELINWAAEMPPYTFFTKLLNSKGRREKMLAGLGPQIIDPLEEFLTMALSYERTMPGRVKQFKKWFNDGGAEIKRDINSSAGVRIMTAHSSKGMDSPIVFLIDTVRTPKSKTNSRIPEPVSVQDVWLWLGRTNDSDLFQTAMDSKLNIAWAEYFRLLYVAMTRARDRLYVYGFKGEKDNTTDSWAQHLSNVLSNHPDAKIGQDETIIIYYPQTRPVAYAETRSGISIPIAKKSGIANYITSDNNKTFAMANKNIHDIDEIKITDDENTSKTIKQFLSENEKNKYATDTGTEIHKKLQHIIIDKNIEQGDLELIKIIKSKSELLLWFTPDAKTEVPIAGKISNEFVSGRIDRMLRDNNRITFIDYKSDKDKFARREHYEKQMRRYAKLLQSAFPDCEIKGWVLWLTDWTAEQFV